MKTNKSEHATIGWLALLALLALLSTLNPQLSTYAQGTAFTYQGRLSDNGSPATGLYDVGFSVWDAATNGNWLAGLTNPAVAVSGGLFTVTLDYGPGVFTGPDRWLDISVRTNGSTNAYAILSPRPALTPAPYAIMANSAGSLLGGLRLEANTNGAPNVIGGSPYNYASSGAVGATISGGGATNYNGAPYTNSVTAGFGTVGGGRGNTACGWDATVGGGNGNAASGLEATVGGGGGNIANSGAATVGGGYMNKASSYDATVGGGNSNQATDFFATVSGGHGNAAGNQAATVAGGYGNTASGYYATVGGGSYNAALGSGSFVGGGGNGGSNLARGGYNNIASDFYSAVVGGFANTACAPAAFVGGGEGNVASGPGAFVGGGSTEWGDTNNVASGTNSMIPGGRYNAAAGDYSFAAGYKAKAMHTGSFVWNDVSSDFSSTADNQFLIHANGGVGIGKANPATALDVSGTVTASAFAGDGSGLANLNAGNISSGTLADARLSGNVALLNSQNVTPSGIMLDAANRPLITRGWDPFNNGPYTGIGRWGLFMEPYNLVLGIPGDDVPGRYFQVRKYALDGSFSTLMTVDQSGNCSVSGKVSASASSANTCAVFGQAINPTGAYGGLFQYGNDGNNAAYLGGNGAAAIFYGAVTANGTLTVNGTFNNYSDRNAKQDFAPVKPEEILEKVAHLPVTAWSYKTDAPTRHIGPMAQDFHAAFDVGTDEKHIAPMDEGGVALAAIQGLNAKVDYQAAQLRAKDAELQALKATVAELQQTVRRLAPTQK